MESKAATTPRGDSRFPALVLAGQRVHVAGRQQLCDAMIDDCLAQPAPPVQLLFDANGQGVSMAACDPVYKEAVAAADIVHADGGFLVKASRRFPKHLHIADRSGTTDLIHDFAAAAAREGVSFYLLGGPEGLAEEAAAVLVRLHPGLKIAGCRNGYFKPEEEQGIIDGINASGADVLWVGLGKPREQLFCARHKQGFMSRWVVTCGGCFHYLTGEYGRAPKWMQDAGLEWLYRMFENPRKLFMRYLITTPHALFLLLTQTQWSKGSDKD